MLMVSESPRVKRTEDNFIRTFTGRKFWPLDPHADEIFIEDIAHHLSNECRFSGATYCHYSVADHSLRVSKVAEQKALRIPFVGPDAQALRIHAAREMAFWGLLHDASEAYLKDIPRPVKHAPGFGELYRAVERMVMAEVIIRFDLSPIEPPLVKIADQILCSTEKRDLMTDSTSRSGAEVLPETIFPLNEHTAEAEFLRRFEALTMARKVERLIKAVA
jgi:5'-deoxynucleotidase YfbR-like HD superfamily hydrolase